LTAENHEKKGLVRGRRNRKRAFPVLIEGFFEWVVFGCANIEVSPRALLAASDLVSKRKSVNRVKALDQFVQQLPCQRFLVA
jgi:hypothetical protein